MSITRSTLPEGLLEDTLNELDITWNDEATNKKFRGFIASGINYLNKKLGGENDYTLDGDARTLLMQYVRYARDQALDVFEANYQSMILSAQNDKAVTRYAESSIQTE